MELVYLWVEEYKNIKNQGFTFSPRFDCKYDKDTNELTIDENKDYVSIFPENINVTAIVGENGSGKSSLMEIVNKFFYFIHGKKVFFIFNINEQLYLYSSDNFKIQKIEGKRSVIQKISYQTHHLLKNMHAITYNNEKKAFYSNLSQEEFNLNSNDDSHISKNILRTFSKTENKKIFENIFQPKLVDIIITIDKLENDIEKYNQKTQNKINTLINNLYQHQNYQNRSDVIDTVFEILEIKSNQINILNQHENLNIQEMQENLRKKQKVTSKYSTDVINDLEFKATYKALEFPQPQYRDMPKHITFCKLEISTLSNDMLDFIWKLPDIGFQVQLRNDKNINFNSLSYGEKNLLMILAFFINLAEKNTHKEWETEVNEVEDPETGEVIELENEILYDKIINHKFFLIDEYELGIHPNWQKEILNNLITFFKNYNNKIHLILITHSPFLLSDLPKENIIFLEKNIKTGNCINVTKDVDINPFGANIHTLLSHGFFMKGLMGEFAKEKIESIIKFHNEIKKDDINIQEKRNEYIDDLKKIFWNIQSIIGDDYLKQVIKNHLIEIEKILLGKDEAKKEEINRLKTKIEFLEQE